MSWRRESINTPSKKIQFIKLKIEYLPNERIIQISEYAGPILELTFPTISVSLTRNHEAFQKLNLWSTWCKILDFPTQSNKLSHFPPAALNGDDWTSEIGIAFWLDNLSVRWAELWPTWGRCCRAGSDITAAERAPRSIFGPELRELSVQVTSITAAVTVDQWNQQGSAHREAHAVYLNNVWLSSHMWVIILTHECH